MKKRLLTSLVIVLVVALMFVLKMLVPHGDYFFDALLLGLACLATYEMIKLLKNMDRPCYKILAYAFPVLIFINHLLGFLYDSEIGLGWVILIDFCLVILCFAGAFVFGLANVKQLQKEIRVKKLEISPNRLAFNKALNTAIVFVYPALLLMLLTLLNHLGDLGSTFAGVTAQTLKFISMAAMLFVFVIAASTDCFSLLCGKLFRGKKLCPKISPDKTISGAVGGLVWCLLISVCSYFVLNAIPVVNVAFAEVGFQFWHVLIFALVGSVVCQLGDLFESFLKRRAGVKDSGKILPGQGGVLDRLDSYLFLAPVILICFCIFLACL